MIPSQTDKDSLFDRIKWIYGVAVKQASSLVFPENRFRQRLQRATDLRMKLIENERYKASLNVQDVDDLLFLIEHLEDQISRETIDKL